jgi:hypothetical protein
VQPLGLVLRWPSKYRHVSELCLSFGNRGQGQVARESVSLCDGSSQTSALPGTFHGYNILEAPVSVNGCIEGWTCGLGY